MLARTMQPVLVILGVGFRSLGFRIQDLGFMLFVGIRAIEHMLASSVQVALMSGRSAEFRANLERPLKYVKREAQTAFQIEHGFLLLRNSEGQELDELQTLGESGWRPGDVLTLQVLPQTKVASGSSFVAIMSDGARVARGRRNIVCVGNVQHVQATEGAFAAVMDNGTIDTWGDPSCGAKSSL